VPLAIGPLLYGYAHAIAFGGVPGRFRLHLAPAAVQFLYQAIVFVQPLPAKNAWDAHGTPFVEPVLTLAMVVSLAGYGFASLRMLRLYRARLAQQRSDDDRLSARWLTRAVLALLIILLVSLGYEGWNRVVAPLDYFGDVGRYLAIAGVGCYLAVEGWRHADLPLTRLPERLEPDAVPPSRDWRAVGETWAGQVRAGQWHRDPELSLMRLAGLLGTNSAHVSRALNEGLGFNFSTFIGRLRCEDVAAALRSGDHADLLALALDAGFGSKATFNRAFRAEYGKSPSAYRQQHGSNPK
jgi:AraC-like DNA-binding protein